MILDIDRSEHWIHNYHKGRRLKDLRRLNARRFARDGDSWIFYGNGFRKFRVDMQTAAEIFTRADRVATEEDAAPELWEHPWKFFPGVICFCIAFFCLVGGAHIVAAVLAPPALVWLGWFTWENSYRTSHRLQRVWRDSSRELARGGMVVDPGYHLKEFRRWGFDAILLGSLAAVAVNIFNTDRADVERLWIYGVAVLFCLVIWLRQRREDAHIRSLAEMTALVPEREPEAPRAKRVVARFRA